MVAANSLLAVAALPVTDPALPLTLPVTLPVKLAVITLALKLPMALRLTIVDVVALGVALLPNTIAPVD